MNGLMLILVLVGIGLFVLNRYKPLQSLTFLQIIVSVLALSLVLQDATIADSEMPALVVIPGFCVFVGLTDLLSGDSGRW